MKTIRVTVTAGRYENQVLTFKRKRNGSVTVSCTGQDSTLLIKKAHPKQLQAVMTDGAGMVIETGDWVVYEKAGRTTLGALVVSRTAERAFVLGHGMAW